MIEVELPDGTVVEVDTDDEGVAAAAVRQYLKPAPEAAPAAPAAPQPTPQPTAEPAGFWDRFTTGLGDPFVGGAQLVAHALPESLVGKDRVAQIDQRVADRERAYQQTAPEGFDWARAAGNVLPTLPLAAAPGGALVGGALSGAAASALQPVPEGGEYWGDKATQAGVGGVLGGAGGAVMAGIGKAIAPKVSPQVRTLMDEGVTPTPGQILGGMAKRTEEKLGSIWGLGDVMRNAQVRSFEDVNRAAINRALAPIGKKGSGAVGRDGIAEVRRTLGDEYDALLPKLQFSADNQFMQELRDVIDDAVVNGGLPPPQQEQFTNVLKNKVFHRMPNGNMDGKTFKGVESELKRISKGYLADSSFDNRELGGALSNVLASIRGTLVRSNPQDAGRLQALNEAWANYAVLRKAAGGIGPDEGVFTPAQLQAAVRAQDSSAAKGNFATGGALMQDLSESAKSVMGSKVPNSGTADRMFAGAAATGGLGYVNPFAALGLAATALPYTRAGQRAAAAALTKRPPGSAEARAVLDALAPYAGVALAPVPARSK